LDRQPGLAQAARRGDRPARRAPAGGDAMRTERLEWDGSDAGAFARSLRAAAASSPELPERVAAIIADVSERGDEALAELTQRFDATEAAPPSLRIPRGELDAAAERINPELLDALMLAA